MNETSLLLTQGSPEWHTARLGSLGASRFYEAIAPIKTGYSATRSKLMGQLISERMTQQPYPSYKSLSMQWGTEQEANGRDAYAHLYGGVTEVGLVRHPYIAWSHASPDGLVGEDGMLEIKCPDTDTHIDTLLGAKPDTKYITQCHWQLACCPERKWVDFVSYDPRMPLEDQLSDPVRIYRDDSIIRKLEGQAIEFLAELEAKIERLKARHRERAA